MFFTRIVRLIKIAWFRVIPSCPPQIIQKLPLFHRFPALLIAVGATLLGSLIEQSTAEVWFESFTFMVFQ